MQARWAEVEAAGEDRKRVVVQLVADCQVRERWLVTYTHTVKHTHTHLVADCQV